MFQFVVIPARFLVYYACITWENNDIANRRLQTKSFSGVSVIFIPPENIFSGKIIIQNEGKKIWL